jgi:hypothetical protein
MSAHTHKTSHAPDSHISAEQLQAAAEVLEQAAKNRALLASLSEEERTRFLKAAGAIFCPDVKERRKLV